MNDEEIRLIKGYFNDGYCCDLDELKNIANKMIKENNKLQSNWNSLRECIIGIIDGAREELNTIMQGDDLEYINQCSREFEVIRKNLEIVLDKMNELEGKKDNV